MDIHQGNLITAEMRAQLKLGMSKTQVRYVLGTPMVNDPFHGDRWDYVYRYEHAGKVIEKQRLTLNFSDSSLQSIDDGIQIIQADPDVPKTTPAITPAVAPVATTPQVIAAKQTAIAQPVDLTAEVKDALQAWADAWSAKDVEQYLASYADTFKPVGMSKSAWQTQRKQRIGKPKEITVSLSDLNVTLVDESHASASFTQNYRADSYQDKTRKTLQLEKIDDVWSIISEQIIK